MKKCILPLALLAVLAIAAPAAADGEQCPAVPRGTLTLTWTNCPPAKASPKKPKQRVHRHAPAPQAFVPPPAYALPQPVMPAPLAGGCPDVYTLKTNVWQPPAFNMPGVETTHRVEEHRIPFVTGPHVSRDHGAQFRSAYAASRLTRSAVPHQFRVSLIMTPEARGGAPEITHQQHYADITVQPGRFYELQFPRALLGQWDAIRTVPLGGRYVSPPRSNLTGYQELRFFNHTPSRPRLGEWENNPVPDCVMNQHIIE